MFNVPILFLIYRQPEITAISFEKIRQMKPSRLYIGADGPKMNDPLDIEECEETRRIVELIDWPCEVRKRFLSENMGLKLAVSGAISWFFSEVEEGIILEYDCIATPSFFYFCQNMLNKYKNDYGVHCITGNNFQDGISRGDGDYYFSHLFGCWGWASWQRSWSHWSSTLTNYEIFRNNNIINNFLINKKSREYWIKKFDEVHDELNNSSWAFCFQYSLMCQGGLCVVPNKNLVSNIGFNIRGTHAKNSNHPLSRLKTLEMNSYKAPTFKLACIEADELQTKMTSYVLISDKIKYFLYKKMMRYLHRNIINLLKKLLIKKI